MTETAGNIKISLNKLAIFGLITITLVALVMKESNIASMAVGGIAGFIGQKSLREVQEEEIVADTEENKQTELHNQTNHSVEEEIDEIVVNSEEINLEDVKEEEIA